jgi:hypothetical protein
MKPASAAMRCAAWLAVIATGWSQLLPAAVAAGQLPTVTDVALRDGGLLIGQVVDPQGAAKAGVQVNIGTGQQTLASAVTDKAGYFAFCGLQGGVYRITAQEGQGAYRAWALGTAPPSAQQGALLVDGKNVVRGASGDGLQFYLSNPWVLGTIAVVAAGTTTAVILANQHPHSP